MSVTELTDITEITAERLARLTKHAEDNLHRIEFSIDNGVIRAKIICTGGDSSACHMACRLCGEQCECDNPDLEIAGRCLWVEWMSYNSNPINYHTSEHEQQIKNGGVIVWWDVDANEYLWTYKEIKRSRTTVDVIKSL